MENLVWRSQIQQLHAVVSRIKNCPINILINRTMGSMHSVLYFLHPQSCLLSSYSFSSFVTQGKKHFCRLEKWKVYAAVSQRQSWSSPGGVTGGTAEGRVLPDESSHSTQITGRDYSKRDVLGSKEHNISVVEVLGSGRFAKESVGFQASFVRRWINYICPPWNQKGEDIKRKPDEVQAILK